MNHNPAIAKSPALPFRGLLTYKAVFNRNPVIRKIAFIEDVAVFPGKIVILVIPNNQLTIFNPEGIPEVVVQVVTPDFHVPALQVFPVEQLFPVFFGRVFLPESNTAEEQ